MVPRRGRGGEHAAPLAGPRALDAKMQRRHRRRGDDEHAAGPLHFACDAYPPCALLDPLRGKADRRIVGALVIPVLPVVVIVPKPRPQLKAVHRIAIDAPDPHRVIRSRILAIIGPHVTAVSVDARPGLVIDDDDLRILLHTPFRLIVDGVVQGEARIVPRVGMPQVIRGVQLVIASACYLKLAVHVVIQLRREIACHGDLSSRPDELPRRDVPFHPRRFGRHLQAGIHIPRLLGARSRLHRADLFPKPAGIPCAMPSKYQGPIPPRIVSESHSRVVHNQSNSKRP